MQMNKAILRNGEIVIFDQKVILQLPRWVFSSNPLVRKQIFFHISLRPVKQNQFFQHWNQQAISCPSSQCLLDQMQDKKPILVVATDQVSGHT